MAINRLFTASLVSAGIALTALGFGSAIAHADGPHSWCPGNPKNMPFVPNGMLDWDWSVCHSWYPVAFGQGYVTLHGQPVSIWDGADPPAPPPAQPCGFPFCLPGL